MSCTVLYLQILCKLNKENSLKLALSELNGCLFFFFLAVLRMRS